MKKKKLFLLIFVLIVSLLLILTNFYTIKVLTAVTAYINGESKYSKGQKDASIYLVIYVQTENPEYWLLFKKGLSIPKGDNIARTSLTNNYSDEVTTKGFLLGENNPEDIPDLIWLFKTFHSVPFMKKAITIWAEAEPLINRLDATGDEINALVLSDHLTEKTKVELLEKISVLSVELSKKETAFSNQLGVASGNIKGYLQYANIFFILLMLSLIAFHAVSTINSLSAFEKALKLKISELNSTNKELENFTYVASHDLQEPLRMITGFLGLLKRNYVSKLDEKAQSYIHFAVDGADRMKLLIKDLLEYSKTSANTLTYDKVDLNTIANDIKIIFQEDLTEDGAGIFIAPLPEIKANKFQMLQLFQNLTGNAIKYRSELPPVINISASNNTTHWIFSIQDNGQGIDKQYFEKVFDVFKRLHTSATHNGTGIGLAICKKIVERHGGNIWIESEVGKGSAFYFSISKDL